MAFLSTEARAGSDGDYGQSGKGYLKSSWHNMPDAVVRRLPEDSGIGEVQIRWTLDSFEGVLAYLTVHEARTLRDRLTMVIVEFEGIDNDVEDTRTVNGDGAGSEPEEFVFCGVCRGRIWSSDNGFSLWWFHEDEGRDHDAVPAEPEAEPDCEVA